MKFYESYNQLMSNILFENKKKTIAVLPGGFKPPHKGHFEVLKDMISRSNADHGIVLIGKSERDGITPEQSKSIWDIYVDYLDIPVKVGIAPKTPVLSVYEYVDDHLDDKIFVGAGQEDMARYKYFEKHPDKYKNVNILAIEPKFDRISGTETRKKISRGEIDFIPDEVLDRIDDIRSILDL